MDKKIVIVGAGVAGINAATKLVDNGYPGELITIIDKGNDPINRLPEEVMTGMLGAGGYNELFYMGLLYHNDEMLYITFEQTQFASYEYDHLLIV